MADVVSTAKRTGSGKTVLVFDTPVDPVELHPCLVIPVDARVKSLTIEYIRIPRYQAEKELEAKAKKAAANLKRHDAAVKANATRKAKKGGKKGGEA